MSNEVKSSGSILGLVILIFAVKGILNCISDDKNSDLEKRVRDLEREELKRKILSEKAA